MASISAVFSAARVRNFGLCSVDMTRISFSRPSDLSRRMFSGTLPRRGTVPVDSSDITQGDSAHTTGDRRGGQRPARPTATYTHTVRCDVWAVGDCDALNDARLGALGRLSQRNRHHNVVPTSDRPAIPRDLNSIDVQLVDLSKGCRADAYCARMLLSSMSIPPGATRLLSQTRRRQADRALPSTLTRTNLGRISD